MTSLFSHVVLELLKDVVDQLHIPLNLWYFDTFVGDRKLVAQFLGMISQVGSHDRLYVRESKCKVFWLSGNPTFKNCLVVKSVTDNHHFLWRCPLSWITKFWFSRFLP